MTLPKIPIPEFVKGAAGYENEGKHWETMTLIRAAENIKVFDLPLIAIDLSIKPWTMPSMMWILHHIKRVQGAELKYPVIMDPEGFIIDGWHRVTKAILEDKTHIKAKRLLVMPEPDRVDYDDSH